MVANAGAYDTGARIDGVVVQEMVSGGVETIVGVSYDEQLGPFLLFGTGGVMVEVYNDVALRACPITREDALEMIDEVKGARLLRGFRGAPAADVDALADTLVQVVADGGAVGGIAGRAGHQPADGFAGRPGGEGGGCAGGGGGPITCRSQLLKRPGKAAKLATHGTLRA